MGIGWRCVDENRGCGTLSVGLVSCQLIVGRKNKVREDVLKSKLDSSTLDSQVNPPAAILRLLRNSVQILYHLFWYR